LIEEAVAVRLRHVAGLPRIAVRAEVVGPQRVDGDENDVVVGECSRRVTASALAAARRGRDQQRGAE
jgi:hypothetical protein